MNSTASQLREKRDIPNQAGFVLELVRTDGSKQLARVAVEAATGCHYCATPSGKRLDLTGKADERPPVVGWLPYTPPQAFHVPGCKPNGQPNLYTREQMETVFAAWEVSEPIPAKGKAVFVNFAPGSVNCLARVTIHEGGKSTEGKTLFACQFYAKA